MIKILLIALMVCTSMTSFSQSIPDTIQIKKKMSTTYLLHGEVLSPNQMVRMMEGDSEAYSLMKKARRNANMTTLFSYTGGFLIGFPLGAAIAGGDPEWVMAGIGAGMVLIAIPFSIRYNNHAKRAVALYNRDLLSDADTGALNFSVGLSGNGLALTLKL